MREINRTEKVRRKPGRPRIGKPHPIDVHVGSRVRLRRTLLGMSQDKLGEALGLTFQQVQKYERGANRIGSSRLFELSQILDVPVSFFFDDAPASDDQLHVLGESVTDVEGQSDPMAKRETLELVRAYYRMSSPGVRRRFFELVKSIANSDFEAALGEDEELSA